MHKLCNSNINHVRPTTTAATTTTAWHSFSLKIPFVYRYWYRYSQRRLVATTRPMRLTIITSRRGGVMDGLTPIQRFSFSQTGKKSWDQSCKSFAFDEDIGLVAQLASCVPPGPEFSRLNPINVYFYGTLIYFIRCSKVINEEKEARSDHLLNKSNISKKPFVNLWKNWQLKCVQMPVVN